MAKDKPKPRCEQPGCRNITEELFSYEWHTIDEGAMSILLCKDCIRIKIPVERKQTTVVTNRNNSKYGGAVNTAFNKSA